MENEKWTIFIEEYWLTREGKRKRLFENDEVTVRYIKDLIRTMKRNSLKILAFSVKCDTVRLLFEEKKENEAIILLRTVNASFMSAIKFRDIEVRLEKETVFCEEEDETAKYFKKTAELTNRSSRYYKWNSINYSKNGKWVYEEMLDRKNNKKIFEIMNRETGKTDK